MPHKLSGRLGLFLLTLGINVCAQSDNLALNGPSYSGNNTLLTDSHDLGEPVNNRYNHLRRRG